MLGIGISHTTILAGDRGIHDLESTVDLDTPVVELHDVFGRGRPAERADENMREVRGKMGQWKMRGSTLLGCG